MGSGLFGLINVRKLHGSERLLIVSYNFALCLIFLALWLRLIQRRILERWVDPLAAGALLLEFSNVLLTFFMVSEPLQNNLVAIYGIAASCFLFSGKWLAATVGIMLIAWAPVA